MGALHDGHISLIKKSVSENDITVVSIFVNPIQFDDKNDLASYPSTLDDDIAACTEIGVAYIFMPSPADMYPPGFSTFIDMESGTDILCGASRPGHFRGVLTVVNKLFNIVAPDNAYFGKKDAQQLFLIKKMVFDLNMQVNIVSCETVREHDGLALSSRNKKLSPEERAAAACLYKAIQRGAKVVDTILSGNNAGDPETTIDTEPAAKEITSIIQSEPLAKIDYVEILDYETLTPVTTNTKSVLIAAAVYFGETRLIDNLTVVVK